jgi:hypothetical protein
MLASSNNRVKEKEGLLMLSGSNFKWERNGGHVNVVELLINAGADLNIQDKVV